MKRHVTVGAILAGGRSRRMGTPKALATLAGRPLVARVVATVGSAGLEPVVVAKPHSPLPPLDCRVLSEPSKPSHPLTGLLAALGASSGRGIVVIGCDMPLVPSRLLSWMGNLEHPVAVCEVGGHLEPLLGRYSPTAAAELRAALAAGLPMREAVATLDPHVVTEDRLARFGDPRRMFFNVNSPADLAMAERFLNRTGPVRQSPRERRDGSASRGEGTSEAP